MLGECKSCYFSPSLLLFPFPIRSWLNRPLTQKHLKVTRINSKRYFVPHQTVPRSSKKRQRDTQTCKMRRPSHTIVAAVEELEHSKNGPCKSRRGRHANSSSCAIPRVRTGSAPPVQPSPSRTKQPNKPPRHIDTHPNKQHRNTRSTSSRRHLPVF